MLGIPRELTEHALKVNPKATPKKQRLRRFAQDKREAIKKEQAYKDITFMGSRGMKSKTSVLETFHQL